MTWQLLLISVSTYSVVLVEKDPKIELRLYYPCAMGIEME